MENKDSGTNWAELLRHPMASMIVGFLLTGVLGAGITDYYKRRSQEELRYREMIDAQQESVRKLAALNADRLARAENLLRGLDMERDTATIEKLVGMYEQAELSWRTEASPVLMAAREVLPGEIYYRFRGYMEKEYQVRFMGPLRECLGQLRIALQDGEPLTPVIKDCRAHEYVKAAGRCNQAVLDVFYELAQATIDEIDESVVAAEKEKHNERIAVACAKPSA